MKRLPLTLALLSGFGIAVAATGYAPPAAAAGQVSVDVGVGIGIAPPPPQFEPTPPPHAGHDWAPGFWRWDHYARRHMWVAGHWIRDRPGLRYHPAHWVQRGRYWHFREGYWGRR